MSEENETKEPSVTVELHFHVLLAAPPRPDWTAWTSGGPNAPRFYGEPPRKSRWIAKSFGVLALVSVVFVSVSFASRVYEDDRARFQNAKAQAEALRSPTLSTDLATDDLRAMKAAPPRAGEEAPRRGTAAFGLH
jgi:hypothetical protein